MCVLQCPCGMVVSTPKCQARCIRCGTVLGAGNLLPDPATAVEAGAETRPDVPPNGSVVRVAGDRRSDMRHTALAVCLSLAATAASRTVLERNPGV